MSDTRIPQWDLGDRLAKARRWAGLEQADLAEDFGMTRQAISKYERGVAVPKLVVIKQWALKTDAPLDWLLGESAPTWGSQAATRPAKPQQPEVAADGPKPPRKPRSGRRTVASKIDYGLVVAA